MKKNIIIGTMLAIIFLGLTSYLWFDNIVIFALSKFYDIDISYKSLNKSVQGEYAFEDLKIMNRKMGLGFYSQRATLKPLLKSSFLKSIDVDFKFKDVHFLKSKEEKYKGRYESLTELVSIPFEGRWTYKDITGSAEIFSNGMTLKDFAATGREIRVLLSGGIFYNNVVSIDITIFFSRDVLKDIPPELHTVIMRDEPDEWKSFSVKLQGNLSSPSIQVSGKQFRLNIGAVVMN